MCVGWGRGKLVLLNLVFFSRWYSFQETAWASPLSLIYWNKFPTNKGMFPSWAAVSAAGMVASPFLPWALFCSTLPFLALLNLLFLEFQIWRRISYYALILPHPPQVGRGAASAYIAPLSGNSLLSSVLPHLNPTLRAYSISHWWWFNSLGSQIIVSLPSLPCIVYRWVSFPHPPNLLFLRKFLSFFSFPTSLQTRLKTKSTPSCVGLYEALGMFLTGFGQMWVGQEMRQRDPWEGRETSLGAYRELEAIDQAQTLLSPGCQVPACWTASTPLKIHGSSIHLPLPALICEGANPPFTGCHCGGLPAFWVIHAWPMNSSPRHFPQLSHLSHAFTWTWPLKLKK